MKIESFETNETTGALVIMSVAPVIMLLNEKYQ